MADKNIGIEFEVIKKGDGAKEVVKGNEAVEESTKKVSKATEEAADSQNQLKFAAEKSKVTIDELTDSLALAKLESEKLTAAANAAVAKDGKTDENRDLRKSAHEARAAYEDLTRTVNAFYEANGQGLEQMKTGYDEHIADLAETQAAQKAVTLAKQEELKVENELRDARREAEKRARKSLKPKAKINQIDDSAIGSGGEARLRRYGKALKGATIRGLKFAGALTGILKLASIGGKKLKNYGSEMQELGRVMRESDQAGAGLSTSIGKVSTFIGTGLDPIGSYIDAVKDLAAEKQKLAEITKRTNEKLAEIKEARRELSKYAPIHKKYEETAAKIAEHERNIADRTSEVNRNLADRAKLLHADQEQEAALDEIDKQRELDEVSDDDPKAAEKRFGIETKYEKKEEARRRKAFEDQAQADADQINEKQAQINDAKDRARRFRGMGGDKEGNRIQSDADIELLKKERIDLINNKQESIEKGRWENDLERIKEIQKEIKVQAKLEKDLKKQGFGGSATDFLERQRGLEAEVGRREREKKSLVNNAVVNAKREGARRILQVGGAEDRARDFDRDQKTERNRQQSIMHVEANSLGEKALAVAENVKHIPEINAVKEKLDSFKDGASSQEVLALRDVVASMDSFLDGEMKNKHIITSELSKLASKIKTQEQQSKLQRQ